MNDFYLWAGVLTVIAIVMVVLPWLGNMRKNEQRSLTNTRLVKQRLTELEQEQQQGLLTSEDKQQAENELKLALLDEVSPTEVNRSTGIVGLVVGILVSLLVGVGSYYYASQYSKVVHWQEVQANTSALGKRILQGDESLTLKDMQDFALALRTRLIDSPEDPIGWMLLGRISGALNRIDSAIQSFELSLQYDPGNTTTMLGYANALIMKGAEQELSTAKNVLLNLVSIEPDNTQARGMLAVVATQLGDKRLALDNWVKLKQFVPTSEPNYAAIEQRIQQLSAELGLSVDTQQQQISPATTKQVLVTVEIAPELTDKVPQNALLFIFAQDANGASRIPAAVVKLPFATFPGQVSLSDKNAMMDNFTLSQLAQAKIVARISADGDVASAPGELQGEQQVDLTNAEQVKTTILIDKEW